MRPVCGSVACVRHGSPGEKHRQWKKATPDRGTSFTRWGGTRAGVGGGAVVGSWRLWVKRVEVSKCTRGKHNEAPAPLVVV